jgi:hypothetical protein
VLNTHASYALRTRFRRRSVHNNVDPHLYLHSVVAIMVLVILVVYRGSCEAVANPSVVTSLKLWPSWSDLITAFPIYGE